MLLPGGLPHSDVYTLFLSDKSGEDYEIFKVLPVPVLEWFSDFHGHNNKLGAFGMGRFLASLLEILHGSARMRPGTLHL